MFLSILSFKISLMLKRAVIRWGSRQYEVGEGETVLVDRVLSSEDEPEVLLIFDEKGNLDLGKPALENAKVTFEVLEQVKGKKVEVFKYKAKSRYRKKRGFRGSFSKIKIKEIKLN